MSERKLPPLGEAVTLTDDKVPEYLHVTWADFWREHTRAGRPGGIGAELKACPRCAGRVTCRISAVDPVLLVTCPPCKIVLTALRLERERNVP